MALLGQVPRSFIEIELLDLPDIQLLLIHLLTHRQEVNPSFLGKVLQNSLWRE